MNDLEPTSSPPSYFESAAPLTPSGAAIPINGLSQSAAETAQKITAAASPAPHIPTESHSKLDSLKISQHIWKSLLLPLLPKSTPNSQPLPFQWLCNENGDLLITLDPAFLESLGEDLTDRLALLPRLHRNPINPHAFTIRNPDLLHLFYNAPQLLEGIYSAYPRVKKAHAPLLQGINMDELLAGKTDWVHFQKSGKPGDYLIIKIPDGYKFIYISKSGKKEAFTYSNSFRAFSSFKGFSQLKRPFSFKNLDPLNLQQQHNALLQWKYSALGASLKLYNGKKTSNAAMGGIDATMQLEDLIAWQEFLPPGKKKAELLEEFLAYFSKSLAHFNSLKGQAISKKPLSLEGMRRPFGKALIAESILRYLPQSRILSKEHRNTLHRMSSQSIRFSNKSAVVISNQKKGLGDANKRFQARCGEILQDLHEGIPVSISTGWAKHNVEMTLLHRSGETFLLFTNRGGTLDTNANTKLYRVTKPITPEMIAHLRRRPDFGKWGEKKGAYFFATPVVLEKVKSELGGDRPQTLQEEFGLELFTTLAKKRQKVGNCTVANGKEMLFNGAFLLQLAEGLEKSLPEQNAIQRAQEYAYRVAKEHKIVQKGYQTGVWGHFGNQLVHDPSLASRHFSLLQMVTTKIVNKVQKLKKYATLASQPESIISRSVSSLFEHTHAAIKSCHCDILECVGPIPFKAGNRIKRGPNGGFGIYKARSTGTNPALKFHLVMKNLNGKFRVVDIIENPAPADKRYSVVLEKGNEPSFTTLSELACIMEDQGYQMTFAL